jgi:hypothetical protein
MLDKEDYQEIAHIMQTIIDTDVVPKFNLLSDGQKDIVARLDRMEERLEDMDVMDTRITALEAMVKKLNREVSSLKKAN